MLETSVRFRKKCWKHWKGLEKINAGEISKVWKKRSEMILKMREKSEIIIKKQMRETEVKYIRQQMRETDKSFICMKLASSNIITSSVVYPQGK